MGVTFAANGIYVGAAAGLLAGIASESAAVGIAVAVGASVVAWYAIRAIEKLLGRGVEAGFTTLQNRMNRPQPPAQYQPPQYGHGYSPPQNPPAAQPPLAQPIPPTAQGQQPWA